MLVLRSLSSLSRHYNYVSPRNASSVASIPATTTPLQATNQAPGRRRQRKIPTQRPFISTEVPRKWNRPIAEGVIPAYDLALGLIQRDSLKLKQEASVLRSNIDSAEVEIESMLKTGGQTEVDVRNKELENMRKRLHILEVQSEVNLPNVRWKVANSLVDMTRTSHRHLLEQRWRKEGGLDLLMERIHQMHVVPDVLPEMRPSIDLHLTTTALPQEVRLKNTLNKEVEPGAFILPLQTLQPPNLYANVFHVDTRLYTMLLVDPDVPDEENATLTTYLHWMAPNIPLSAARYGRIPDLNKHTPYIPPHPQRGTPYHRYVFLLLPQPPSRVSEYMLNAAARTPPDQVTSAYLDIPIVHDRKRFDVRRFMQQWGLDGSKGGGIHMFRQIWDEDVSRIYAETLKEAEPRYGRPRKPDTYSELKQTKHYV